MYNPSLLHVLNIRIWLKFMVNVGKDSIHSAHLGYMLGEGWWWFQRFLMFTTILGK